MYTILIIEDDSEIRRELKLLLENALYQVITIEHFGHMQEQIMRDDVDLILMDVNLPGIDGMELCRSLRQKKDVPVIFVTGNVSCMDELNGMLSGGDDYITKPYQPPLLLARIAAVLKRSGRGGGKAENTILMCRGCELNLLNSTVRNGGKKAELTRNELRICHYLFSNQGRIISRAELTDDLWENRIYVDDNTLSVNMTRIRNKLKGIGVEDLIQTKRGQGYLC